MEVDATNLTQVLVDKHGRKEIDLTEDEMKSMRVQWWKSYIRLDEEGKFILDNNPHDSLARKIVCEVYADGNFSFTTMPLFKKWRYI